MQPIFSDQILLEKSEKKGSWTFVTMPVMPHLPKKKNSTVRVRGTIDDYVLEDIHIWAMKKGTFLAVKAEIRKAIKKEAGDTVHITLYPDDSAVEIPGELQLCLEDEPQALRFFNKLSDSEKKYYIQWIYSAKKQETKIDRMAKTIERLSRGLKMYDKE